MLLRSPRLNKRPSRGRKIDNVLRPMRKDVDRRTSIRLRKTEKTRREKLKRSAKSVKRRKGIVVPKNVRL